MATSSSSPIRHIVLFKLKPEATQDQIAALKAGLFTLPKLIPNILFFNVYDIDATLYKQDHSHGYSVVLDSIFASKDALAFYGPNPNHQNVIKTVIDPIRTDNIVVDYELPEKFNPYKKEYSNQNPPYLQHLVLFPLNLTASPAEINECYEAVETLRAVPGVADVHITTKLEAKDMYPGYLDRSKNMHFILSMILENKKSLQSYLVNPIHKEATPKIMKVVSGILMVDYEI